MHEVISDPLQVYIVMVQYPELLFLPTLIAFTLFVCMHVQLYKLLQSKLLGGHYHAIRHAFKIFSPQGNLIVTKCALYRLLRNFVPGLTPQNYSLLLKRYIYSVY